jgi:hypothetical protein
MGSRDTAVATAISTAESTADDTASAEALSVRRSSFGPRDEGADCVPSILIRWLAVAP